MTRPASPAPVTVPMLAASAALLALATTLTSCGDAEDDVAPQPTATVMAGTTTPGASPASTLGTPVPVPSG